MSQHTITQEGWRLVDQNDQVVTVFQTVTSFRGETSQVLGGQPPLHSGSTGRVWTTAGEFFPSVYSLRWVQ